MAELEVKKKGVLKANWRWLSPLISLLIDLFLLNTSFAIAILIRAGSLYLYADYTKPLVFFNGMFFVFGLGLGLYRSRYNLSLKELRFSYKRLVIYLAISTMAFLYIIKRGQFYSRAIILITFFLFYLLLELAHALFKKVQSNLINRRLIGLKTIVIGTGRWTYQFFQQLSSQFDGFFQVSGYIQEDSRERNSIYEKLKNNIIGELSQFDKVIEEYRPDMVFITSGTMEMGKYASVYETCKNRGIRLKMISSRVSNVLNNSRIRDVSGASLVVEKWRENLRALNTAAKRIFDLFFVALISPVLLPVGIIVAVLIKLTSKGPVFFKQKRSLYQGGTEFEFIKFRSMYRDADLLKEKLFETNEADGALFKMRKDPRITPFGRFIRKLSLDELPQFINVLKGDMSIVGPRPLPVKDFSKIYEEGMSTNPDWYKKRGDAKPGITGLWQISGRSDLPFEDMLYLDLYYVEHQSVFLDLEILFETIPAVLLGRGAY
ncbi:MAG: sugar transferase [Candidatus Aminicenantes bacterium]|nr:sugar transferase [Candidatus Aminicenantes bacterium]